MKTYTVTVCHDVGINEVDLLYNTNPQVLANSFSMAIAIGESQALRDARTGKIISIKACLNK